MNRFKQLGRRTVIGAAVVALGGLVTLGAPIRSAVAQVQVPPAGASKLIDQIKKNGELRAGTAIGAPGLLQDPGSGQLVGPAMTIGEAIAKHLGVKFTPVQSNWDVIIAGLQSGRYELAIAPLRSTPQRLEVVDLVPYYSEGLCYSMRKDNPKTANITTIQQLDNPAIQFATVAGSSPEGHIRKSFPLAQKRSIQAPPGGDFITEEVIARRADVASLAASQVKVLHARFPDLRTVPALDDCLKSPDDKVPTGMAILKGDPAAVKFMTEVVQSIEPQIQEALQKYTSPEFMIRR
jgi:polar amino acid transport system substrate-binding protein